MIMLSLLLLILDIILRIFQIREYTKKRPATNEVVIIVIKL